MKFKINFCWKKLLTLTNVRYFYDDIIINYDILEIFAINFNLNFSNIIQIIFQPINIVMFWNFVTPKSRDYLLSTKWLKHHLYVKSNKID